MAILVYVPLNFRSKMLEIQHFTQILNGLGKLSINAFQMHSTHVGTTSNEKITLITHFYMILVQFYAQKLEFFHFFPIFSSLLHWQSTIHPSYDISQYAILFSNQYSHSTEKIIQI